jgi:16S rRNA (uracil1498-N3)-methyltransferase
MKSRLLYAIARAKSDHERFDKIILAAMKQSNEFYLPKLNEAVSLKILKQKDGVN